VSSLVRPEYGPTLAEIAGPRWPRLRLALIVVGAILAVYLVFHWVVQPGSDRKVVVVHGPVAVNVLRDDALAKVTPQGTEELRLRGRGTNTRQTYAVSPLTLPTYVGPDPGGVMPEFAEREIQRMQRDIPGFRLRGEGRTRINLYPGYAITYTGGTPGTEGFFYGKRIFLYPDAAPHPTQGVMIDMRSPRTVGVQYPDAVGLVNPLKLPLRSFNFGTERP
jgi:hypothetical protein